MQPTKAKFSTTDDVIKFIFFGNYFYGICAVALSIEATLQQEYSLNSPVYFAVIFCGSIVYYTFAYQSDHNAVTTNPRTLWYKRHRTAVRQSQSILLLIILLCCVVLLKQHLSAFLEISLSKWLLIAIFPITALFYYGLNTRLGKYNLRSIGWLKPFVIGFIWAGIVTVYPVIFQDIIKPGHHALNWISIFLFIKNFMFISVLCIMFDIKDYAMDYNARLKTFVVNVGLRKTIFQIIIPLCITGLASFLFYGVQRGFGLMKLGLNVIPFLLLIIVAYSLHNRRSVLYYLIIIDGLMLVKAICGILAMLFF